MGIIFYELKADLFLIILFLNSACYINAQEIPHIANNELLFSSGTKLQLSKNTIYHIYNNHKRLIYITYEKKSNFSEYYIYFFDFSGKKNSQSEKLAGEFIFMYLEEKGMILAGQSAALIRANTSYLFNSNGQLIHKISHDYETKEIGVTHDEKYFWFVSNKMRPLRDGEKPVYPSFPFIPYNHVLLFDTNNGGLVQEYISDGTSLTIEIFQKKYTLFLSEPDIPG